MTSNAKPKGKAAKPKTMTIQVEPAPVELSPERAAQKEAQQAKNRTRPYRPKSKVEFPEDEEGKRGLTITMADGQDPELYAAAHMEALGTGSLSFLNDTMDNVIRTLSPSRNVQTQQYNAAVALMAAIEPQNELEATLASQMVAANDGAFDQEKWSRLLNQLPCGTGPGPGREGDGNDDGQRSRFSCVMAWRKA